MLVSSVSTYLRGDENCAFEFLILHYHISVMRRHKCSTPAHITSLPLFFEVKIQAIPQWRRKRNGKPCFGGVIITKLPDYHFKNTCNSFVPIFSKSLGTCNIINCHLYSASNSFIMVCGGWKKPSIVDCQYWKLWSFHQQESHLVLLSTLCQRDGFVILTLTFGCKLF